MIDPFTAWSRMIAVGASIATSASRAAQTATASQSVIDKRSAMMRAAVADPSRADYPEMSRMLSEKVTAFTASGTAAMAGLADWHAAMLAEAQHLAVRGGAVQPPTPFDWFTLMARSAEFGLAATERNAKMGAAMLAPLHAKATSNARRLAHRKRRG